MAAQSLKWLAEMWTARVLSSALFNDAVNYRNCIASVMDEWMTECTSSTGGMTGENRRTERKTRPSATLYTANPICLTWDRTRFSAMRGLRLTAWAMAQRIRVQTYVCVPDVYLHSTCSRSEKLPGRYPPGRLFVCWLVFGSTAPSGFDYSPRWRPSMTLTLDVALWPCGWLWTLMVDLEPRTIWFFRWHCEINLKWRLLPRSRSRPWPWPLTFTRFLDHTQRRATVGRTPLDEWSALRRDLYLSTHNTHNRQTSMPPVEFEPTSPAGERPQTFALDRAATGIGTRTLRDIYNK